MLTVRTGLRSRSRRIRRRRSRGYAGGGDGVGEFSPLHDKHVDMKLSKLKIFIPMKAVAQRSQGEQQNIIHIHSREVSNTRQCNTRFGLIYMQGHKTMAKYA
jgi:hypothetical protein